MSGKLVKDTSGSLRKFNSVCNQQIPISHYELAIVNRKKDGTLEYNMPLHNSNPGVGGGMDRRPLNSSEG